MPEQMIVFICGSVNAGKSTVGKMLAERLGAAFIEGDDLRKVFYKETVEIARPAIVEAIAAVARVAVKREGKVVVAYPLWEEDYQPLMSYLKDLQVPMHFIALNPSLDAAVTNRGTRELQDWEVKFIKELYARGVNSPTFAKKIDNTSCTPQQSVDRIVSLISE